MPKTEINPVKTNATEPQPAFEPGDILKFKFPTEPRSWPASPHQAIPCAIHDVHTIAGAKYVTLVASEPLEKIVPPTSMDIDIIRPEAMAAAGLASPTRFSMDIRVTVSLNHSWFMKKRSGFLAIGRFMGPERIQFFKIRRKIKARIKHAEQQQIKRRNGPNNQNRLLKTSKQRRNVRSPRFR